jgi:hypothetical protein
MINLVTTSSGGLVLLGIAGGFESNQSLLRLSCVSRATNLIYFPPLLPFGHYRLRNTLPAANRVPMLNPMESIPGRAV